MTGAPGCDTNHRRVKKRNQELNGRSFSTKYIVKDTDMALKITAPWTAVTRDKKMQVTNIAQRGCF
jgi:hypothetical protein